MLIIAVAERPVGVAGIMGGFDSEVTNETTTVMLKQLYLMVHLFDALLKLLACAL